MLANREVSREAFTDQHEFKVFMGKHPLSFDSFEDAIELLEHVGVLRGDVVGRRRMEQRGVPAYAELVELWP